MEASVSSPALTDLARFYEGKNVLVTGHTGFKGSWLTLWLLDLGARVHGYGLPPPTHPSLFEEARLAARLVGHQLGDVRDSDALRRAAQAASPEIVFHLAAEALVGRSYTDPSGTFDTNVMGTVHLLEAVRQCPGARVCQVITSDKCYWNRGVPYAYRERDSLGGSDPYSASKACAEIVSASYRQSFFNTSGISLATARAGNVIGGGDWARDRLLPDCIRALELARPIVLRHSAAVNR